MFHWGSYGLALGGKRQQDMTYIRCIALGGASGNPAAAAFAVLFFAITA
jgi:hypothetical protein